MHPLPSPSRDPLADMRAALSAASFAAKLHRDRQHIARLCHDGAAVEAHYEDGAVRRLICRDASDAAMQFERVERLLGQMRDAHDAAA